MPNDLLIKINADAKNAKKAFDDMRAQTEDLEGALKTTALVSAAAFAAFTAEITLSVMAFEDADKASRKLSQSLQNQGIFTEKLVGTYKDYAKAVQEATGIDDDAVIASQAVLQGYLGQTKITKELTFAVADLAEKMGGNLDEAAQAIGKTIGTSTNALAKQGLTMSQTATEGEKMAKVLDFVNAKAGGMAAAANQGVGGIRGLKSAFGDFQESIGERFAPVIAAAIKVVTGFFTALNKHPIVADLAVALLTAGAAITGIVALVTAAIPAFLALSAAAAAIGVSMSVAFLGIPLLIGAVIAGITLLALNWDKAMAFLSAAAKGAVEFITGMFSSLGTLLSGVFTLDRSKIAKGLEEMKAAFKKSKDVAIETYQEITASQAVEIEKQDVERAKAAEKEAAQKRQHQANLRAIHAAEIEVLKLQNANASAETIALKQQELEILKALDQDKSAQELALYREKFDKVKALQDEQRAEDLERETAFTELQFETRAELAARGIETETVLRDERLVALRAEAQTEADIDRQTQEEIITRRTAARNQELADRKKFGTSYAAINKALHSDEVKGAEGAAGELVGLANSKNSTLKAIGKAAAVTQIGIDTAKGAMAVYANFQTAIPYPPVSVPLGLAAAAALTLYGVERVAAVTAAADGGIITGGIAGKDSVPALLMPGELVVPKRNFNDVVGAVKGESGGDLSQVLTTLQSIDQKISTPQTTIIQGDVMGDDAWVDAIVRKISDAVEHRNGQIFGVTA